MPKLATGRFSRPGPDALILCYSMSRKEFLGTTVKIPPLDLFVEHYEATCRPVHRCKVVGIAINSLGFSDDEYFLEKRRITKNLGLPVTDVIREGASPLVDALLEYQKEIGKINGNMKNEAVTS